MEDKIEVNEYVRTNKGNIGKVVEIRLGLNKDTELYQNVYNVYILDNGLWTILDYIVKHSKNLIELIEPGELIKTEYGTGWFHHKIDEKSFLFDDGEEYIEVQNEDLMSILTREQYEANCYKVGGEE